MAQGVDGSDNGIGLGVVGDGMLERADHGPAGDSRVDGEEDVVQDDEDVEGTRLADPPGLVAMLAVVCVEQGDGGRVDSGDGQRHDGLQGAVVDVLGDGERVPEAREGSLGDRRWDGRRGGVWGKLEDGPLGELARVEARSCTRHDGGGGVKKDDWAGRGRGGVGGRELVRESVSAGAQWAPVCVVLTVTTYLCHTLDVDFHLTLQLSQQKEREKKAQAAARRRIKHYR